MFNELYKKFFHDTDFSLATTFDRAISTADGTSAL